MIVIRKQALMGVGLLTLFIVAIIVGWANTPFESGQALLLTREARAIQVYMARARHWSCEIARQNRTLHELFAADMELIAPQTPVPTVRVGQLELSATPWATPWPAGGHPGGLYVRSERAHQAQANLEAIQREMEATALPPSLSPLHDLAQHALGAALGLSERTLAYVGAPTPERLAQLIAQWDLAQRAERAFSQAVGVVEE